MSKLVFFYKNITLCSLSWTRSTENKESFSGFWRMNICLSKLCFKFNINFVSIFSGIDSNAVILRSKISNDRNSFTLECSYSFLHGLRIIICATTGFRTLGHTIYQGFLRALKINQVSDHNFIRKLRLELVPIFLISWESIKQIASVSKGINCTFQ